MFNQISYIIIIRKKIEKQEQNNTHTGNESLHVTDKIYNTPVKNKQKDIKKMKKALRNK
jgi:hypothetical protein